MRVTDKLMFDQATLRSSEARGRLEAAIAETSTGLRVAHPGDDPAAAGLVVGHRLGQKRWDALGEAAGRAADELLATDNALGELNEALTRAREVAMQMSNGTYSAAERAGAAQEVAGLFGNAIALMNRRFGDRYLFGGRRDESAPFDAAGAFSGDAGTRKVEIAPGVLQDASVRGDVIAKGAGGGVDVFAVLQGLQTALSTNNVTGVQGSLDGLDAGIRQVSLGRAQAGTSMNLFDAATAAARTASVGDLTKISHLTEADTIESASRLALAQRALDAALTASAQGFQLTLLKKL